jgi:glycosyltransferase involved in cell wall biosynthesis
MHVVTQSPSVRLVTIIIPCFRQAQFLPLAIESALGQSYPNVDVIVVNDGSPDDTSTVARRYGERVKYIEKENGGLPSARNAGLPKGWMSPMPRPSTKR